MNSPGIGLRQATGILALLVLSLALPACGGGGTTTAGGGIGGTGLTAGVANGFGSVIVSGVTFATDNTTVRRRVDDNVVTTEGPDEGIFQVGMILRVRHTDDNNALEIDFHDDLEGPATNLTGTAPDLSFSILGQPVVTDGSTNIFLEPGAAPLGEGSFVEISGLYDADGVLRATFIEVEAGTKPDAEIKGFVSNLDNVLKTFTIGPRPGAGTIAVDYGAAVLEDLPAGMQEGLFVEVKTALPAQTPLLATFVEGKTSVADDAATAGSVSIEGFVADLSPAPGPGVTDFTFVIDGLTIRTSAATTGVSNVASNARVQVEGTVANGILSAGTVSPR